MPTKPTNRDDIIDSRDVIERIAELTDSAERTPEEDDELRILSALADEAAGYAPDWEYGETMIRRSYFVTYAEELAEDIGAIDRRAKWPNNHIDWEAAAEELEQDYTTIDFDGVEYLIR